MASSLARVKQNAIDLGLSIAVVEMPESTRTTVEAAAACDCEVGQIVKSLIFAGSETAELFLFLVCGDNQVDIKKATTAAKQLLERADPNLIRKKTGFAIGGVSPIGHKQPIVTFADEDLLKYQEVWAAAGTPRAVFAVDPTLLISKTDAKTMDLKLS
jgi:prolyl-tRNA editing enzyme YbaK/EbsC (Cys-tRNA(Pro) deacylase)